MRRGRPIPWVATMTLTKNSKVAGVINASNGDKGETQCRGKQNISQANAHQRRTIQQGNDHFSDTLHHKRLLICRN